MYTYIHIFYIYIYIDIDIYIYIYCFAGVYRHLLFVWDQPGMGGCRSLGVHSKKTFKVYIHLENLNEGSLIFHVLDPANPPLIQVRRLYLFILSLLSLYCLYCLFIISTVSLLFIIFTVSLLSYLFYLFSCTLSVSVPLCMR